MIGKTANVKQKNFWHPVSIGVLLTLTFLLQLRVELPATSAYAVDEVFENEDFVLSTLAFRPGSTIGKTYTADGDNNSPPLSWVNPPANTKSYAIIAQGQDGANGDSIHWIIYDIPAKKTGLREAIKQVAKLPDGSIQAKNSFGTFGYYGPAPAQGTQHRYYFTLYALDTLSDTSPSFKSPETDMQEFTRFINLHTLGKSELICTYSKR